ncbi:hypothetical protein ODZ83_07795 [Acaricomes phytoseiuli]|uniref:hypothetical protein n=1 Tax=Acaricomes phytoseiuli TaxID=291968 RepID=UPI0022230E71|nr:hypothetical protein [Acaricomes phytoseiuli]MCW1250084.1 hypothetical protein [Acaricomes phytoseiuli]
MSWSRYQPELGDIDAIQVAGRKLEEFAQFWELEAATYSRVASAIPAPGVFEGAFAQAGGDTIAALVPDAQGLSKFGYIVSVAHQVYAGRIDQIAAEAKRLRALTDYRESTLADAARYRTVNAELLSMADLAATKAVQGLDDAAAMLSTQIETGWDWLETDRRTADNALKGLPRVWLTVGVWGDQAAFASV